jgi:MFS transporter, DHA1 family, tetracycline resistance protein
VTPEAQVSAAAELPPASAGRRRTVFFILVTVTLDAMGIGLLIPVIPKLIQQLTHQSFANAAVYGGWLTATFAAAQFVAGPVLGSLSDRLGRRPVLLASLAAFGLSYVVMAAAPSLGWLFIAQLLTGIFGATPATAGALIADITPPAQRTGNFGLLQAAFGTGLILGPAAGGMLAAVHLRAPFLLAAGISLLTVCYGALVLPESLRPELRRPFSWSRANPFGAITALHGASAGVGLLLAAAFFQRFSTSTLPAVWPYFTMQQYAWTERGVGYSLAAFGAITVFVQVTLLRWFDAHLGARRTAWLGLALLSVGYLAFAFVSAPWVPVVGIPLTAMGFVAGPALIGMLSMRVRADTQGVLQGVLASLNGVAAVVTPLAMPALFSAFSTGVRGWVFPGAPYLVGAGLACVGVFFIARSSRADKRRLESA